MRDRRPDQPAGGDFRGASAAHAHFFFPPNNRRGAELILTLDARCWNARAPRRDRKCLRPIRGRATGFAMSDARFALRHRPRRRQSGTVPLGLLTAISCVANLHQRGRRLPFAIEVTGFADEEGVRFASTLLGSRAVAGGTFNEGVLASKDSAGISMRDALIQFGLDPRPYRRGCAYQKRIAGLYRIAHRAGTGVGSPEPPRWRGFRHCRCNASCSKTDRYGRPCRHGADGAEA